jgi:aspartyl-tRNA synthetase
MYRSHNCGGIERLKRKYWSYTSGLGTKSRDKGFMNWVDLRDRYGLSWFLTKGEQIKQFWTSKDIR